MSYIQRWAVRKKQIMILLVLVVLVKPGVRVVGFTVDDVRDIVGEARLDERYTEIEQKEIEQRYKEVEQYNQYAKIFQLSEIIEVDEGLEEEYVRIREEIGREEFELEEAYRTGVEVGEILSRKSRIETLKYKLTRLKEIGYEMTMDYVENEWESEYKELQETLASVKGDYEVGHVGLGLRSPVYSGMILESIYGFRLNKDTGASLEFHPGIDIVAVGGEPILSLWNGVVTNITKEAKGYIVEITHGEGLKTRYAHLRGLKVEKGQEVKQYKEIGEASNPGVGESMSYLHLEVELDKQTINPLYVFGQEGINAAREYISKNPDRNREIHEIEREIQNKPAKERPEEEEEQRYERADVEREGEIKVEEMREEVAPLKPWEIFYLEQVKEAEKREGESGDGE